MADPVEPAGPDPVAPGPAEPGPSFRAELADRLGRRAAALQADEERFSLLGALGGVRGLVEAVVPGLLFLVLFTATGQLRPAAIAALAAAGVATAVRLARRSPATQAFSGLIGVGFCVLVAARSGHAADYYLTGFFISGGGAVLYGLSALVGWPLLGLALGFLLGEGTAWRGVARRRRVYLWVTWLWTAMFVARVAVQVPLYLADEVTALGTARLLMGVPLYALVLWATWMVLRAVPVVRPAAAEDAAD